jgi:hypothetical protein
VFPTQGAEARPSGPFSAFRRRQSTTANARNQTHPAKFFVTLINFAQTSATTSVGLVGR